ncbi:MAG: hypothetical protein KJ559_02640 [Nanoarchaeota archaeon]|nr:hypothetical protein [Nanoarchaeota archaeon]
MEKRGQMTIPVIISIIIIGGIILFFTLSERIGLDIFRTSKPSPYEYMDKCVEDSAKNAIEIMLPQAGFLEPENYMLYKDKKVGYLCYNRNYYEGCVMQKPNYIAHLEQEIKTYITPKIKDCFYLLKKEYENRKYEVKEGDLILSVSLKPKIIDIRIEKKLEITKDGESEILERFKINFLSSLFDLGLLAQEIASQEAKYCYFEYLGYMILYPYFDIDKKSVGSAKDSSKIYIIGDRRTQDKLYIAIRSCAINPGRS